MDAVRIGLAKTPADIAAVKRLFLEYLRVLETEYANKIGCSSGQEDLQGFPRAYQALFLAKLGGLPIAACALKRVSSKDIELGKLYCRPQGRGHAAGRALTEASLKHAGDLGYERLVLSTEAVMEHAVRLYCGMGFEKIDNYACGEGGCSQFMAHNV